MSGTRPVVVAVVGHTNTGKTSLLRTLTRDVDFGEVSDRPAVTRHVEGTALLVNGRPVLELYDTPGLEDSIGLLDHLEALGRESGKDRSADWVDVIQQFLDSPQAQGRYAQEAKALRQVMGSDVSVYVIDARDRVLGKHRDELMILSRCARPVVPVLNFTASEQARTSAWRDHLSKLNLHAVAEFDTVVLDEDGERRLFEKMQTLLDRHRESFRALIEDRGRQRERLTAAACRLVADMLLDVAAFMVTVPANEASATDEAMEQMKQSVRAREVRCVGQLLELFRFRPEDGHLTDLPLAGGRWGSDVFSPEAMKEFGVRAGGAAAAGAMAGLAVDAMSAGITMGAATATGAAIGALLETSRSYGRRVVERMKGFRELRCNDNTLRLLLARQLALVHALLRRGHAAVGPVEIGDVAPGTFDAAHDVERKSAGSAEATPRDRRPRLRIGRKLPSALNQARRKPRWSSLQTTGDPTPRTGAAAVHDQSREAAEAALSKRVLELLQRSG